ncbi:hypothetical protein Droror1_Dr00006090 [Drosera rotundifolia]
MSFSGFWCGSDRREESGRGERFTRVLVSVGEIQTDVFQPLDREHQRPKMWVHLCRQNMFGRALVRNSNILVPCNIDIISYSVLAHSIVVPNTFQVDSIDVVMTRLV